MICKSVVWISLYFIMYTCRIALYVLYGMTNALLIEHEVKLTRMWVFVET